jgi:hypothetical protein
MSSRRADRHPVGALNDWFPIGTSEPDSPHSTHSGLPRPGTIRLVFPLADDLSGFCVACEVSGPVAVREGV